MNVSRTWHITIHRVKPGFLANDTEQVYILPKTYKQGQVSTVEMRRISQ